MLELHCSLSVSKVGMPSAFCCRKLQSCCEAGPNLSHVQVRPHQPVLSLIMQPLTCTSNTVTQLRRRSSLPWDSCEFSKSMQNSYLFCTLIWDRTSWSKLRNTPAALLGPFSQLENKEVRVGMGGVVFHKVRGGFLQ